ncbi:hypothetical protein [Rhizobium sp. PAMB 3182]
MAEVNIYNLKSAGQSISLSNTRFGGFKNYVTDHTKAEVIADGYFNKSRKDLSTLTVINVLYDADGTPGLMHIRPTAVPASGNVTVAVMAPATS